MSDNLRYFLIALVAATTPGIVVCAVGFIMVPPKRLAPMAAKRRLRKAIKRATTRGGAA